jgi:hypothetical protein
MKNKIIIGCTTLVGFLMVSCSYDRDKSVNPPENNTPNTYNFTRADQSTVSYSGQTTRLQQADELYDALNSDSATETVLDQMFNGTYNSNTMEWESAGFDDENLNGTSKIVGKKTSSSLISGSAETKALFDQMITEYTTTVVPYITNDATEGAAGYITGSKTYFLNNKGQELDQLFTKGLIGAFTLDQIVNNYIHPNQLDSGNRTEDNTNEVLASNKPYTEMEHKWDEGFGYLYGQTESITENFGLPASGETSGTLLMKYFKKVDEIYENGIAETVYDAFIAGRAAIVNKDYTTRAQQAQIIKVELSKVIGYYAIHYMKDYIAKYQAGIENSDASLIADAHHSLSEAWGFILSLQFTNDGTDQPFMSKADVESFLSNHLDDFYNVELAQLNAPANASNPGMIYLVKQAYANKGVTLNITID